MQVFMQPLEQLGEFDEIRSRLVKNRGILQVSGCVESQNCMRITVFITGMCIFILPGI